MAKLEKINKTENKQNFFFILKKKKKTALVPQLEFTCYYFPISLFFPTLRFFNDVIDHRRNLLVAPAPFFLLFSIFFSSLFLFLYLVFLPSLFFHCIFPSILVVGYTTNLPFFLFSLVLLVSIQKYKMGLG